MNAVLNTAVALEWTEETLAEAIGTYKAQEPSQEFVTFLRERIVDESPVCVAHRPELLNELGLLQIAAEEPNDAAATFEQALALRPTPSVYYNYGTLLMNAGDQTGAILKFESALELNPTHLQSLINTALCYLNVNDTPRGLAFLEQAVAAHPQHGYSRYMLGETLLQQNRGKEALPHFEEAYRINDGHFESASGYAIALLKNDRPEEAIAICDKLLATWGPAMLPLQVKGDAMLAQQRYEEAIQCHLDMNNLDLDIRDFLILRLRTLKKNEPTAYAAYRKIVEEKYPSFLPMVENAEQIQPENEESATDSQK